MAYRYVHTTNEPVLGHSKSLLTPYVSRYLFSLINGLSRNKFRYGMDDTAKVAIKFFESLNLENNEELYIDSGGYSIIVGDVVDNSVTKMEIAKFIDNVYLSFLSDYANKYCHKIFSLDIPIFLTQPEQNTAENIYYWNKLATTKSKQILDNDPSLYDKYTWVWHFKIKNQFNIWRKVYDEVFGKDNNLKHFAVGGLVSLRGITGIKYSPFIAPTYRILKLIRDKNLSETSLIHILGVYGKHDRFLMQFMNELFNKYYLKDSNASVDITFDTVNYTLSGLYKVREQSFLQIPLIDPEAGEILKENVGVDIYLDKLIKDPEARQFIKTEISLIEAGQPITDPKVLSLTYTIYSYMLDYIMGKVIKDDNLLELFLSAKNWNQLKEQLKPKYNKWKKQYPFVFQNMETQLHANFKWMSHFHINWEDGAKDDMERLDRNIDYFAHNKDDGIRFPFDIEGNIQYP